MLLFQREKWFMAGLAVVAIYLVADTYANTLVKVVNLKVKLQNPSANVERK